MVSVTLDNNTIQYNQAAHGLTKSYKVLYCFFSISKSYFGGIFVPVPVVL